MTDVEKYIITRWLYSIGETPLFGDKTYTILHRLLFDKRVIPEYTDRSWSSDPCPYEILKKFRLERYSFNIITGDKTSSMDSLVTEDEVRKHYENITDDYVLMYKYNGWNIQVTYHNKKRTYIQTRGRTGDSLDVTGLGDLFPNEVDCMGIVRVIGELMLSDENFVKLKDMFPKLDLQSQRASVRTAIANKCANHLLTFIAFEMETEDTEQYNHAYTLYMLQSYGFKVPIYRVANNYEKFIQFVKDLSDLNDSYGLPTDGIVARTMVGGSMLAIRIFHWEEGVYRSYIIGYEEVIKGYDIPLKLLIRPIQTSNAGLQRIIPITNPRRVIDNKLKKFSPVAFTIRSDATPVIDLEATKLLQQMYEDVYEYYCGLIDSNELEKINNQNLYINEIKEDIFEEEDEE